VCLSHWRDASATLRDAGATGAGLLDGPGDLGLGVLFEVPAGLRRLAEIAVAQKLLAQRHGLGVPGRAELLGGAVPLAEPGVEELAEGGGVGVGQVVQLAPAPRGPQRVLVVDLHKGDRRLLGVRGFRVGVDVGQQIAGVLLLQLDHARLEVVQPLVVVRPLLAKRESLLVVQPPRHVQVQVRVDAVLLELVDEVVELLDPLRVDDRLVGALAPDRARVHVVHAHAVDAEAGEPGGHALGLLALREAGVEAEVGGPEADRPGVGHQAPLLRAHEAVFAGRLFQPRRDVGGVVRGVIGEDKGKQLLLGRRRHEENETHGQRKQRDARCHGRSSLQGRGNVVAK